MPASLPADSTDTVLASPFPPSPPPPSPGQQSPSPSPTPSPTTAVDFRDFEEMPALGTVGRTRVVVWFNDPDFALERFDRRPLNLVSRPRAPALAPTLAALFSRGALVI